MMKKINWQVLRDKINFSRKIKYSLCIKRAQEYAKRKEVFNIDYLLKNISNNRNLINVVYLS